MDLERENVGEEDDTGADNEIVEEAAELLAIIKRVVDSKGADAALVYPRYKTILCKYQEQSQLLDAILEDVVVPLSTLLRITAVSTAADAEQLSRVLDVCRLLNVLVLVRGYKTVVKFFPHEAADLEKVLSMLMRVQALATTVRNAEDGLASWEAQGILLLWLSILILIPFELSTVDSTVSTSNAAEETRAPYTVLVARILQLCKEYLQHPGVAREMSALLLGRLLTRPDMRPALSEFLDWTDEALSRPDSVHTPFLVPGVLQATCFVFKLGQRATLLPFAHRVWATQLSPLLPSPRLATNALARKLAMKLVQRVALTFLPPRLAPWRYTKDSASLDTNLAAPSLAGSTAPAASVNSEVTARHDVDEDNEYELVDEVEEIIGTLVGGLRDRDTVVRWSAAKGVGRLTGCLPQELGEDVVSAVLEAFSPTETDTTWHGSCLAVAELARRGLLLPSRLPSITPCVVASLRYDVRRGPHSIGAHVRDAAAYVCWAWARAYAPEVLADSVSAVAGALLTAACYDREVNCRRAAAAAFQEAVGRLGNFPHGIALLGVADYFSVGNINQAYLHVAPLVAAFSEYQQPLACFLVTVQLRHWEKSLRKLAARGVAALAPACYEYLSTEALDMLLPSCLDPMLEVRHGAVVGVAELLPALQKAGAGLDEARIMQVCSLVPAIDKARLYRGKGGEIMREAVSRLIETGSMARMPLSTPQRAKVLEALDENLRHPHASIQTAAVAALRQYARAYVCSPAEVEAFSSKPMAGYLGRLHDANVAVRRGYSLALGALSYQLLQPAADRVVSALIDGAAPEEDVDERDVDSRVNCINALGQVCTTLYTAQPSSTLALPDVVPNAGGVVVLQQQVVPCLLMSLADYTTDNRGDVGSWVREAAMAVLSQVVGLTAACLPQEQRADVLPGLCTLAVGQLLKQAVERIARVREAAAKHLHALLSDDRLNGHIPAAAELQAALRDVAAMEADTATHSGAALDAVLPASHVPDVLASATSAFSSTADLVPRLAALIGASGGAYAAPLLAGLAAAIGGVDAQLSKSASAALLAAVTPLPTTTATAASSSSATGGSSSCAALLLYVAQHLLGLWSQHARSARLATPLLRVADLLVTKTEVLSLSTRGSPTGVQTPATPPPPEPGCTANGVNLPPSAATTTRITSSAPASASQDLPTSFAAAVAQLARAETRGCSDIGRLLDAGTLLCHLLPCADPTARLSALQGLMVLLVSKFPRVRRHTAEQMYLQLLSLEPVDDEDGSSTACGMVQADGSTHAAPCAVDSVFGAAAADPPALLLTTDSLEAGSDLLLATSWDGDIDAAKVARDELAKVLHVPLPKMKAGTGAVVKAGGGKDENASYQSLLDDFARFR